MLALQYSGTHEEVTNMMAGNQQEWESGVNTTPDPDGKAETDGLAALLAGLLGGAATPDDQAESTLQGLVRAAGATQETGAAGLLERLLGGGKQTSGQLPADLVQNLRAQQATGSAKQLSPAIEKAVEALGLPPALAKKLIPLILERLLPSESSSKSGSTSPKRTRRSTAKPKSTAKTRKTPGASTRKRSTTPKSGSTTRKRTPTESDKPAKPRAKAKSEPESPWSISEKPAAKAKTRKSSTAKGTPKSTTKKPRSSSSGSTARRPSTRRKTSGVTLDLGDQVHDSGDKTN